MGARTIGTFQDKNTGRSHKKPPNVQQSMGIKLKKGFNLMFECQDYRLSKCYRPFRFCILSTNAREDGRRIIISRHLTSKSAHRALKDKYTIYEKQNLEIIPYDSKLDGGTYYLPSGTGA